MPRLAPAADRDQQRSQERALWRALRFDAGPAPRM